MDAVHPLLVAHVRHRRQQGRRAGSVQPGRRNLRRGALPEGRGRRHRSASRDLRLQPRRLVCRLGDDARTCHLGPARRPRRLAHRSHPGSLPGSRPGALRGRPRRGRDTSPRQEGAPQPQRGQDRQLERPAALDQHLRATRRSGDRDQRRRDQEARREPQARSLHHPAGRLRQPLHVRAPGQGLEALPGAEELRQPPCSGRVPLRAEGARGEPAAPGRARECRQPARGPRPLGRRSVPAGLGRQLLRNCDRCGPARARQGAPVRRPEPSRQPRDRRAVRTAPGRGRLRGLQGLLLEGPEAQAVSSQVQDPQEGVEGHRRHRSSAGSASSKRVPAPSSAPTSTSRSGRPVAAHRGSTRSRSSTGGSCSRRPPSTARSARTRS